MTARTAAERQEAADVAARGARAAICLQQENSGTKWERRKVIAWRVEFAQLRARQKQRGVTPMRSS